MTLTLRPIETAYDAIKAAIAEREISDPLTQSRLAAQKAVNARGVGPAGPSRVHTTVADWVQRRWPATR